MFGGGLFSDTAFQHGPGQIEHIGGAHPFHHRDHRGNDPGQRHIQQAAQQGFDKHRGHAGGDELPAAAEAVVGAQIHTHQVVGAGGKGRKGQIQKHSGKIDHEAYLSFSAAKASPAISMVSRISSSLRAAIWSRFSSNTSARASKSFQSI